MKYLYYPGCSQKSSAISYDKSFLEACRILGAELVEPDDWNCCGTTIAISVNKMVSLYLGARNLGLANRYQLPVVTPCPSCYISLMRVLQEIRKNIINRELLNRLLKEENLEVSTDQQVFHSLEFIVHIIGLETIRKKVRNSLKGFKIAPYYGCQLAGPYAERNNSCESEDLEKLIEVVGAEPVSFFSRTICCGGSLMFTLNGQAKKISSMIISDILRTDANLIVTPCGLCQMNLETAGNRTVRRNSYPKSLPIINIGQLLGLALDLDSGEIYLNKKKMLAGRSIKSISSEE